MESLIIRTDASTQIGTGHLMRCLALGQAWKDAGGKVTFITACQNRGLLQRLKEEGFDLHPLASPHPNPSDWDYTKDTLADYPNCWVVLDGYHFDEGYQQRIKEVGHRLLVIDDLAHLKHYYADILLNQNLRAEQLQYPCEPDTRLLLGTRYVLLRREFLTRGDRQREIPEVAKRVLVTLGGSDPENHTLKVIQALQKVDVPNLEATVVVGASNARADALEKAIKQSRIPVQLVRDAWNMPELMSQADAAVSGFGITCWELAYMGVPTLAVITMPNQAVNAKAIQKSGMALTFNLKNDRAPIQTSLLQDLLTNAQARTAMSRMGRVLVNGHGAKNVAKAILDKQRGYK